MTETTKVKPIRATDEVIKRFNALTENFSNQGAALEALINAWEIQNAKSAVPERESDIADFDSHIQSVQRAFVHSLELAQNADARAMDTYRRKLETLEAEKEELRRKLEQSETTARFMTGHRDNALKERDQEQARANAAEKRAATLETALESEKANAAAQIADKQKLIDNLTAQVSDISDRARENAAAVAKAATLQTQLAAAEAQILQLKNQAEIDKGLAEIALEKAVAAAERKAARDAAEYQEAANVTIRGLYQQINQLMERVTAAEEKANAATVTDAALMNDQQTAPTPKPPRKRTATKKANDAPTGDAATTDNADAPST